MYNRKEKKPLSTGKTLGDQKHRERKLIMTTLGKYGRSVSIIGVGCTPFMYTVDNPETDGLTE